MLMETTQLDENERWQQRLLATTLLLLLTTEDMRGIGKLRFPISAVWCQREREEIPKMTCALGLSVSSSSLLFALSSLAHPHKNKPHPQRFKESRICPFWKHCHSLFSLFPHTFLIMIQKDDHPQLGVGGNHPSSSSLAAAERGEPHVVFVVDEGSPLLIRHMSMEQQQQQQHNRKNNTNYRKTPPMGLRRVAVVVVVLLSSSPCGSDEVVSFPLLVVVLIVLSKKVVTWRKGS